MNLIVSGPPNNFQEEFCLLFSSPTKLLVQLALCAHSVFTLEWPAFLVGWETGCKSYIATLKTVRQNMAVVLDVLSQIRST